MCSTIKTKEFVAPEKYPQEWLVPKEERENCKKQEKEALDTVSDILGIATSTKKKG